LILSCAVIDFLIYLSSVAQMNHFSVGVGAGGVSMSCSPAPDSSGHGVHDLDDEKLDVVGTSDGRDGASPLHISDGKCVSVVPALSFTTRPAPGFLLPSLFFGGIFIVFVFYSPSSSFGKLF
jgi:hypothetical protein